MASKKTVTPKPKKVKRKPAEKPTFLRPEDRLQLLEALNKAKDVIDSNIECGSAMGDTVHDAQHKLHMVARKLGYKDGNFYCDFTI
tara:strand:+ start:425 stop:682 length:258 start_codon:yes stop_codon:yes gene_type:complete